MASLSEVTGIQRIYRVLELDLAEVGGGFRS